MKYSILFLTFLTTNAFADVTCVAQRIVRSQVAADCASVTIPSNSVVSTSMNCGVYRINVDCDIHNHAFKLTLGIKGPNGAEQTISQNTDLELVDAAGDGAAVSCSL